MTEILIMSANRSSGTSENFTINFDSTGTRVKLLEASIPLSFNNILATTFFLTGSISGPHTYNILEKRYTATELVNYLQSQIVIPGQTYLVGLGSANEIIITSSTENFALNFPQPAIGFSGIYPANTTQTGESLTSILQVSSHILICSPQIRGIDNGIKIAGTNLQEVLHAVPLCTNGLANYRASKSSPWITLTRPLLSFYLSFPNGFPVNLNGTEIAFKILIET
jgi:hypothetical protein